MYRAALRAGHGKPVWGALTGVRPGKLLCAYLRQGLDEEEALRRFREEFDVSPERAALCLDASRHTLRAEESLGRGTCASMWASPSAPPAAPTAALSASRWRRA